MRRRGAAIRAWKRNESEFTRLGLAGFVLLGVLAVVPEARKPVVRGKVTRQQTGSGGKDRI
jgi:hypothetical protein